MEDIYTAEGRVVVTGLLKISVSEPTQPPPPNGITETALNYATGALATQSERFMQVSRLTLLLNKSHTVLLGRFLVSDLSDTCLLKKRLSYGSTDIVWGTC